MHPQSRVEQEREVRALKAVMVPVPISLALINKAKDYAKRITALKLAKEPWRQQDPRSMEFREITGKLGEIAVEQLLGVEFTDYSVGTDSTLYKGADLTPIGLNIGVKTKLWPTYPMLKLPIKRPEILCFRSKKEDSTILVAGYASKEILEKFEDKSLIDRARCQNPQATCFYGLEFVEPFHSLEELKYIHAQY